MLAIKAWKIMRNDIEIGREPYFEPAYKSAIELMKEYPGCEMVILGEDKLIILNDPAR